MYEGLSRTLNSIGKPTEIFQFPDGTTLLVLPHGGRILGLFAPRAEENFYWTHPALASAESARAFYESDEWHNSGGDRTWLAPEVDVFFPHFPDLNKYWQPRTLDPGKYQVVRTSHSLQLANRLTITLSRSQQEVDLQIAKSVTPAPNPLRHERRMKGLEKVEYAGYTLHTTLEIPGTGMESAPRVGLWNLVQMPHGGELWVPTYVRAIPRVYFGTIGAEDLIVDDHLVRYKMRALGIHKIGIRAVETTGRAGYLYSTGDKFALIIRSFSVNPSGEYVDVPFDEPEDLGYSTQACNVNSALGCFSELEYHVPAIGGNTGRKCCEDISQVWAFRGSRQDIRTVANSLLSPTACL